jgi:Major Facilitator Superfamily
VPIAGRMADRGGPRRVLAISVVLYAIGLGIAALAPSMFVVVSGRFVQGIGGGGLYTASLATVAKTYPDRIRPRVMALLASMWILPGLVGPSLGSLIATTVGWRWAFIAPIPAILIGVALILPALRAVEASPNEDALPIAPALVLMVGAGVFLAGLTELSWLTAVLAPVGLAIAIPALLRITPPGTLSARRGIPAAAAAAFLTSFAFIAVDGFLTLMLHRVRGLSLGISGLVISGASVSWAAGSWWESRVVSNRGARSLTRVGASILGFGTVLVASGLLESVPVSVSYVGWAFGGLGMGILFPTIPLAVMSETTAGREAGELSSMILMDFLGIGIGAGLGGVSVALADAGHISLRAGVAGAFAMGLVACVALVLLAGRIPDGRPVDSAA